MRRWGNRFDLLALLGTLGVGCFAGVGCGARQVDPEIERRVFAVIDDITSTAECPGPRSPKQIERSERQRLEAEAIVHSALLR